MQQITSSLGQVSTDYWVFEKDQVLTEEQLNSLTSYLDDQDRLTRVALLGVGLVAGLRTSVSQGRVVLSPGFGVTTDGDLVRVPEELRFDRTRPYGDDAPRYGPLRDAADQPLRAHELVPVGRQQADAVPLSQLGQSPDKWLAVLLVESCLHDQDECSPDSCDNLGRRSVHTLRLLLVDPQEVGGLLDGFATLGDLHGQLDELLIDRPEAALGATTLAALAAPFQDASERLVQQLGDWLERLAQLAGPLLAGAVAPDPGTRWAGRLADLASAAAGTEGIQYVYGVLKDLAQTCNELREALFDERSVVLPDIGRFPKHLVLGQVGALDDPRRTPFHPSPAAAGGALPGERARFLARRLDAQLASFVVPEPGAGPLRVTPSAFEDSELGERALPFYYASVKGAPIHARWSQRLSRRGDERRQYGYRAAEYQAVGAAREPLRASLGPFPFFRVEGHVGRPVEEALKELQRLIVRHALPFTAVAVCLSNDRDRLVVEPPARRSELPKLHFLMREDLSQQLEAVEAFGRKAAGQLRTAVTAQAAEGSALKSDLDQLVAVADARATPLAERAVEARRASGLGFGQFGQDATWSGKLGETIRLAGELQSELSRVADLRTSQASPALYLSTSPSHRWLGWLEELSRRADAQERERLLFRAYLEEHPGLEHHAGVLRGGTFVMVHDEGGTVVADFMLPYTCCAQAEPPADESPLPKTTFTLPELGDAGLVAQPLTTKLADIMLETTKRDVLDFVEGRMQQYGDAITLYQDSMSRLVGKDFVFSHDDGVIDPIDVFTKEDAELGHKIKQMSDAQNTLDELQAERFERIARGQDPALIDAKIAEAEEHVVTTTTEATKHLAESQIDLAGQPSGGKLLAMMNKSLSSMSDETAKAGLKSTMLDAGEQGQNVGFGKMLKGTLGP